MHPYEKPYSELFSKDDPEIFSESESEGEYVSFITLGLLFFLNLVFFLSDGVIRFFAFMFIFSTSFLNVFLCIRPKEKYGKIKRYFFITTAFIFLFLQIYFSCFL